jgi:hypothetical protein
MSLLVTLMYQLITWSAHKQSRRLAPAICCTIEILTNHSKFTTPTTTPLINLTTTLVRSPVLIEAAADPDYDRFNLFQHLEKPTDKMENEKGEIVDLYATTTTIRSKPCATAPLTLETS